MGLETTNALSSDVHKTISEAKVFVVGAGGIGCELIKNLVLVGFRDLEIIDLDTIDVSNLNRQFLFQKKHVGKSKAKVAHENAVTLRPNVKVTSHHASIFNPEFNIEYFKRFHIVLNALDNRAARNHVNRICLAAGVPLVESGSAGYLGQVSVIKKGVTECYECSPKPRQKTFPGCTIRNTPSELIHCVVWAKYLFNQLFGEEDADQDVSPDTEDPEAAMANSAGVERVNTRNWAKENNYKAEMIFNKLFKTDIEYLLSMEKLWVKRTPPTPIKWSPLQCSVDSSVSSQKVLTFEENVQLFGESVLELSKSFEAQGADGMLVWDKDDKSAMEFVACTANLRAQIFGIQQKSIFDIKSMAGNIIPAIATTNAVVAGLIVMQALFILKNQFNKCKNVYVCRHANPAKKLIAPCMLDPPKPTCYVCAEKPEVTLKCDTNTLTLGDLKEQILKSHLGMQSPDVEIEGTATIVLSSEEGESEENWTRTLDSLGIRHGVRLRADDFQQDFDIAVNIIHEENLEEDKEFEIVRQSENLGPKVDPDEDVHKDADEGDSTGDLILVENNDELPKQDESDNKKRKHPSGGDAEIQEQDPKRPRMCPVVITESDNDIMIIE